MKYKQAIIWRKSIHDRDYICRCGKKLMTNDTISEDLKVVGNRYVGKELVCPNCGWNVAKLMSYAEAIRLGAMRDAEA